VCLKEQYWEYRGSRRKGETVLFQYSCCDRVELWTQVSQEVIAVKGHYVPQTSGRIVSKTYLGSYVTSYPGIVKSLNSSYGCSRCTREAKEESPEPPAGRSGYN
jgi:hypothetical protein